MSLLPDLAHLTLALPDYPEANLSCSSGPITLGLTTFALGRPYFEGLLRWLTEAPLGLLSQEDRRVLPPLVTGSPCIFRPRNHLA